jgi:hypothetical protein
VAGTLLACASSPIVDGLDDGPSDDAGDVAKDAGTSEAPDDESETQDEDESESSDDDQGGEIVVRGPAQSGSGATPTPTATATDTGTPVVRAPAGAGNSDAGSRASTAGAGQSTSPGTTPPAAASAGDSCEHDSDCQNLCVPVGILPCCNLLKICGCTWAPGAYCL